jgi:hypothetical protein
MKTSLEVLCPYCGYWTEGDQTEGVPEAPEYCLSCNEFIGEETEEAR